MTTLRRIGGWMAAVGFCVTAASAELSVTPLTPIESPGLTRAGLEPFKYPSLAASGTNAIFTWNQQAGDLPGDGTIDVYRRTNLFSIALDSSGQPVPGPGEFVAPTFHPRGAARLLPAEDGFFAVFEQNIFYPTPGSFRTVFMRLDRLGRPALGPIVLPRANGQRFVVASNQKTMLFIQRDLPNVSDGLNYTLVDQRGATLASGQIAEAVLPLEPLLGTAPINYVVASDGLDYLVVWKPRDAAEVRATHFRGNDGTPSTLTITNTNLTLSSLGYGKPGYLLVTGTATTRAQAFQLDGDGRIVASAYLTATASAARGSVVYEDAAGWVVFTGNGQPSVDATHVEATASGLTVRGGAYRSVYDLTSVNVENVVAPFGPEKFLVAEKLGISVLTKTGQSMPVRPHSYVYQSNSRIVASQFGYLVIWIEKDMERAVLRGLRLALDGTQLDEKSFVIANQPEERLRDPVWDGSDYVVAWRSYVDGYHMARIAPQGLPNVRKNGFVLRDAPFDFSLVAVQGRVFLYYTLTVDDEFPLYLFELLPSGALVSETRVHGDVLVRDGANLYSVGTDTNGVYRVQIQPGAAAPELNKSYIEPAPARSGYARPLNKGFAAGWAVDNKWFYAAFADGVERFRSEQPMDQAPDFAGNEEYLLVTSAGTSRNEWMIRAINLSSGESASRKVDLGDVFSLKIASAGRDFLAVTDMLGLQMHYVGKFWITSAAAATFGSLRVFDGGIKATLALDADRRYRIEVSDDWVNWSLLEMVNGTGAFEMTAAKSGRGFIRAAVVPE